MFNRTGLFAVAVSLAVLLFSLQAEARGGGGATSSGMVHVNGYIRQSGTYVHSYYRSAPGNGPGRPTRPSTVGPGVVVSDGLVQGTFGVTEGTPEALTDAEPAQTKAEWQAECRTEGQLVGTGWGFCVLTKDLMASAAP